MDCCAVDGLSALPNIRAKNELKKPPDFVPDGFLD